MTPSGNGHGINLTRWILNGLFTLVILFLGIVLNDLKETIQGFRTEVQFTNQQLIETNKKLDEVNYRTGQLQVRINYIEEIAKNQKPVYLVRKK